MLITAGIDKKYIISTVILVVISVPLIYNFILPEHAKKRIDIFLNPESDPRGSGYNIIQSKLAIGAGGVTGMGLLKGNQTQLGFLYPKTTDFIFAVIGEEMGFVVAGTVIILYILLITKCLYVAKTAKDEMRFTNCFRNNRNICVPYVRKYRNGNGAITNYRCTTSIYKLWRKLINYKFYMYRNIIKY